MKSNNELWEPCTICGAKLLRHPSSGQLEACPSCNSRKRRMPLMLGLAIMLGGTLLLLLLLAVSMQLLF